MSRPRPDAGTLRPLARCLAAAFATAAVLSPPAAIAADGLLAGMAEPLALDLPRAPGAMPASPPRAPATLYVANCNDSGPGSLRDVIAGAAEGDTVDMSQLACSTISLTTGAIIFAQDQLALVGPGRHQLAIDASNNVQNDGLLVHLGFGTVIVEELALTGGHKYRSDTNALGGCIQSQGNVLLRESSVTGCKARSQSNHASLGGGIWTQGSTYLQRSEVSGNTTVAAGNGYASGGGVYALGGLTAIYSLVMGNSAYSPSATPSFGGGVFTRGYAGILESTVAYNRAARMGGVALADTTSVNSSIFQSTITGNSADRVGGVYSRWPLYLYNSTIADNTATVSIDTQGHGSAAGLQMGPVLLTFHSSILSDNFTLDNGERRDLDGPQGVLLVGTHNLVTGTPLPPPPDTIGFTPALGPLQDHGGRVPTREPIRGESYAIDSGGFPTNGVFTYDQRGDGFPRWIGAAVDIGAFETDPDRIFINGFNFGFPPVTAAVAR